MTKPLRETMPFTTSIIDDFRANWPEADIVAAVRAGIDGQPTFWARENGQEIGTRAPYDANKAIAMSDTVVSSKNAIAAQRESRKGKY